MTTPVFDRRKDPSLNVAPIERRLKQTICLAFLGAPSLDELAKMSEDSGQWSEFKALLTDRSNNVGVIAALVVTSSAVYVAANPPTDISKWLPQFPYVCMLASYGAGMLSIVFSFAHVIFLSFMGPGDIDVSVALGYSIPSLSPAALVTTNDHRRRVPARSIAWPFSRY
ncbi:hypothetical protein EDC04DRAFT_2676701 [Pisolithus marmoratus]|nr:hypothetical protein EDC04DRAFT_2676701 [Pisolithus marmoratus]